MNNSDNFNDLFSKLNIYDRHIYKNGKSLHGSAALNKQISTANGFSHFIEELQVLNFVYGFSDYYWEEINRLDESDIFLNFDRSGVGNEKREILRGLTDLQNHQEMQLIVKNAYNIIKNQYKGEFKTELQNIFHSNYILDGKIINIPVGEVW